MRLLLRNEPGGDRVTALVLRSDARRLPLPDQSVDLIVTSPPYFALRSYTDAGEHYDGQIGSEPTPAAWLKVIWECTREMMRVLKPEGSLWVNLGDKYVNAEGGQQSGGPRVKSLIGIPWRYAIGCIDQLGLILRAELIWSKPNGLPESVTDRVRRSHEQWFHFVKQSRYYAAVDEIREAQKFPNHRQIGSNPSGQRVAHEDDAVMDKRALAGNVRLLDARGKLPGSVWSIPSEPLTVPAGLGVDHFAAFPTEWPRRLILGWSPPGICTACGQGRRPVVATITHLRREKAPNRRGNGLGPSAGKQSDLRMGILGATEATITGYVCACEGADCLVSTEEAALDGRLGASGKGFFSRPSLPPTRPAVVLDPFGGTGTTALVAHALGRVGITVDMSADYSRLAAWRTTDRGELAKAMRVPKPAPVPDGQLDMFDLTLTIERTKWKVTG
jgi:DNA modification methylase